MRTGSRARPVTAAMLLVVLGCAPGPLLDRAIRARGGPLPALARRAEVTVAADYPGTWRSRVVFARPERLAWTIETAADPNHYLFDGDAVRAFIGSALVSVDRDPAAPLRTHARFTAVLLLDRLRAPGVEIRELGPAEVPAGAARGLAARFLDDGARYVLGFDDRARLVRLVGPLDLPGAGRAIVTAELSEFRRADRWWIPRRIRYRLGDRVLADERSTAVCPIAAGLPAAAFRDPAALPACP